jgi:Peptidase family M48
VDGPQSIRDQSGVAQDASPVEGARLWEREAQDNILDRLQKTGVLAPEGEVDRVMQTVVNNLIFTNNLNVQPKVRIRVLLTTPLESFAVGRTIVVSRGLLDVLPDETTLAMILAHELAHLALGHRDPAEERAADQKAMQLLANSPYKERLRDAGLFLRALQAESPQLKNLIRLIWGRAWRKEAQPACRLLPPPRRRCKPPAPIRLRRCLLGARIRLDPWSCRIDLVKGRPVSLTSFREKMPFEITPFFPIWRGFQLSRPTR